MKTIFITLICLFLLSSHGEAKDRSVILFWNVENYFDPFDTENQWDEDFTPEGKYHWTWSRFKTKRNALAKTILATGDRYGQLPAIIGLAEVESGIVMNELVYKTPLAKAGYKYIHRESPDKRGIDVAMLYREEEFRPIQVNTVKVSLPDPGKTTRDILHVKGILQGDTIHFMVNHWPSKYSGESYRMAAAAALLQCTDSIAAAEKNPRIIITGDFNDYPDSNPVKELDKGNLVNLALPVQAAGRGTLRYKGNWELIDQFIVSPALSGLKMDIYDSKDLLIYDERYPGMTPHRLYLGPRYQGGISDHLPIVLFVEKNH